MIDFERAYAYGLIPKCPANIDRNVFNEWTMGQKIIFQKENEGNFLVACIDESEGAEHTSYSFLRFFTIGDITHCSADFQSSSIKDTLEQLTILLAKRHTF